MATYRRSQPISRPPVAATGDGDGAPIVWMCGEHDLSTAGELTAALAQAISSGAGDLVVDLGAVTFMDASTMRVLGRARRQLAERDRALVIREPSTEAQFVLSICERLTSSEHAGRHGRRSFSATGGAGSWGLEDPPQARRSSSAVRRPAASGGPDDRVRSEES